MFLAAAIQLHSTEDKASNIATATRLVEEAAARGATLVALPEMFNCLGRFEVMVAQAEPIPGPTSEAMAELARRFEIVLLTGTIAEQGPDGKAYNTSLLISPYGELVCYRKIHLFDIALKGQVVAQESQCFLPGCEPVTTRCPLGRIGQAVCYDLRFPELFRALADDGAEIILVPSAFMLVTGRDHWEVLLRARAIENQAYVIAPNQYGQHTPEITTYGHSAIVDPWGKVLAMLGEEQEGIALAEIDLEYVAEVRRKLPALRNRKLGQSRKSEVGSRKEESS